MLNLSGLSGFVKGSSFLETNWTGLRLGISPFNEAGGGVCKNTEEFDVFRCDGGQTGVESGVWGNDVL